jgi:hypothetical protein
MWETHGVPGKMIYPIWVPIYEGIYISPIEQGGIPLKWPLQLRKMMIKDRIDIGWVDIFSRSYQSRFVDAHQKIAKGTRRSGFPQRSLVYQPA